MSWYEAVAFCRWIAEQLRLDIRLPSEVEWEKATRGADGREFPWGDGYRTGYANIDETFGHHGPTYLKQTTAVGMYPIGASPYGLLDAAGNAWDWCLNKYDTEDDTDLGGAGTRVLRGGSWCYYPDVALSAPRFRYFPDLRSNFIGFSRVVFVPHRRSLITEVPRERHRRRVAPSTRRYPFFCYAKRDGRLAYRPGAPEDRQRVQHAPPQPKLSA